MVQNLKLGDTCRQTHHHIHKQHGVVISQAISSLNLLKSSLLSTVHSQCTFKMTPYCQGHGTWIIEYSLFYGKYVFCSDFPEAETLWLIHEWYCHLCMIFLTTSVPILNGRWVWLNAAHHGALWLQQVNYWHLALRG